MTRTRAAAGAVTLVWALCSFACTRGSPPDQTDSGSVDVGGMIDGDGSVDAGLDAASCVGAIGDGGRDPSPSLTIAGDPGATLGYGDPSLLYPADAATGFMTYSAVSPSSVLTRFATSTDRGATWSYVGDVNAVTPLTITTSDTSVCGAANCAGSWVHEVSSIVEDPTDPDGTRRIKVFAHSYFIQGTAGTNPNSLHYDIGSIDLWTTSSLQAGATWTETRLLGWTSSSPRSSTGVSTVVSTDATLSPMLGGCIALTEPGALVHDGVIELALGCERYGSPTSVPIEIDLIRSTDHGAHWIPVSRLLDLADATSLGATGSFGPELNAADLFVSGGTTFLFVTPNGPVTNFGGVASGYRGCLAIPFADLGAGQLVRCGGVPAATPVIQGAAGLFNGACTWAEGASAAGVMGLSASTLQTPAFQIFASGASPP